MTIVVDENIPYAAEAFGGFGETRLMSGRAITRQALADADALVVRSITRVDKALLDGTPVRFVGTATIGVDHIDLDYLAAAGIGFAAAGGSNANSVAEYVVAALLELRARGLTSLAGARFGIVGAGAIGGRLIPFAVALGMDVVPYDPPRAIADPTFRSAHYDELFACDILTFHVPLTTAGPHPTHHLVDGAFLGGVRPGAIVINSSRGGVVDSAALIEVLRGGRIGAAVLDVWEGEPAVPVDLVESVAIATPHIAGYSTDAKLRGTAMMADAMARFTGGESTWSPTHALPARAAALELPHGGAPLDAAHHAVRAAYDITRDDADIRALLALGDEERRARFDRLRKNYRLRREFSAFEVASGDRAILELLTSLGFSTASRAPH